MINLYSYTTPNGRKPAILLEELQLPYTLYKIDLSNEKQFAAEYIKINPNSKIPAIYDLDANIKLAESGAILIYLAEKAKSPLLPSNTTARSRVIQWLLFQVSGIGPMFGQFYHFSVTAKEKNPYAIQRYQEESLRLVKALDTQLSKTSFMAGDYSIADIATYPYISAFYDNSKVDAATFPHIYTWLNTIADRPAIKTGMSIFTDNFNSNIGKIAQF